ncbi:MAG TPA: endonuclease/exonuclease/phosphatase family protein [Pyrinomonadaceae bacterium]|nr:endonuclease/exonuclease/phosphatase family protein [Pyrinomonadaceae bacterium]
MRPTATLNHPHEAAAPGATGLEFGGASLPHEAAPRTRLVFVTYNIRYAVGSFLISGSLLRRLGLGRPARRSRLVARHVEAAARALSDGRRMPPADVVALQEADRGTLRAGGRHVARELAEAAGMSFVRAHAPTPRDAEPKKKQWYLDFEERIRRGEEGDTGVALLGRVPLEEAARVELPWADCAWRPRLALSASVRLGHGRLRVFNLHIDPHAGLAEQLAQHRAVLSAADASGGPVVLLGDFNTLSRRSCAAARALLESRGYRTPLPTGTGTWRAGPLRLHADWIFTRDLRVTRWGVARGLGVSDHWPVWAEVEAEGG